MKKEGNRDVWRIEVSTDKLAAGRKELRDALAEVVRRAAENGWVEAGKAERWLEKLERGRVLMEGWPKYHVGLPSGGALVVRSSSTNSGNIEREARRLRDMGLEEGVHFTVKMPEGRKAGYLYIRREGLEHAAWISVYGSGRQQELAAEFVSYILQRAWETGKEVYEKAKEIVEEGKARGSLRLEGFERVVEVNGSRYKAKVIGGDAELEERRSGKTLLRIRITAEVDGVRRNYTITFSRRGGDNAAVGYAYVRADPDGGETDAERPAAVIKALTDREPKMYRMKNGNIIIKCSREHLDGFRRYAELADAITK